MSVDVLRSTVCADALCWVAECFRAITGAWAPNRLIRITPKLPRLPRLFSFFSFSSFFFYFTAQQIDVVARGPKWNWEWRWLWRVAKLGGVPVLITSFGGRRIFLLLLVLYPPFLRWKSCCDPFSSFLSRKIVLESWGREKRGIEPGRPAQFLFPVAVDLSWGLIFQFKIVPALKKL